MGQHKTPTHSGTSLFYTSGQKMEPTRPVDSWVSHLFDHSCRKEMSPSIRGSFINPLPSPWVLNLIRASLVSLCILYS